MLLVKFRCRRCFRTWRWTEMNEWEPWTATCGYVGCVLWMSHKEETWTEEEVFLQFYLECLHVSVVALVSQGFVDHTNVSGVGSTLLKMGRNISPLTTVNWKPLQTQHDLVEPWPSWQHLSRVWGGRGETTRLLLSEPSFPVILSLWRCLAAKIETERVQLEPWLPLLTVSHGIFLSLFKVLRITGTLHKCNCNNC